MAVQVCPLHSLEEVHGEWVSDDVGWRFTCPRSDHVRPGSFTWLSAPSAPPGTDMSGIAADLGLGVEIPAVLKGYPGKWIEYGVFEHAYATSNPKDWVYLIDRYGHRAITPSQYTVSAFLAATLGNLQRAGVIELQSGPATGRWSYNGTISWLALPPEPDWNDRTSWSDSALTVHYVPGQTESP